MSTAAAPSPTPGPRVTGHDGVELGTTLVGPPERPRVLLQHGVGSSTRFLLDAVAPPLVAAGWCVVAADLRGHGDATPVRQPERYDLAALAGDVAALAAAVTPTVVGGVSLGAHAAAAAAARGLVDVAAVVAALPAWTGPSVHGVGPHAVVADEVRRTGVVGMRARLRSAPGVRPWLREVLLRDLGGSDHDSLCGAFLALDGGVAPSVDDLVSLRPHLAVVGWPDDPGHPLAVARAWARAAASSSLATLTLDDPDEDPTALGRAVLAALHPAITPTTVG